MRTKQFLNTKQGQDGQSIVEYALILVLVALAFGFAVATTGPAIGNVFSNTVYNLLGQTPEAREIGGPADFWMTVTWVAANPQKEEQLPTRTPAPPTATSTPGPPPPPTEIVPTNTEKPTSTPKPTATPEDFWFNPEFLDSAEEPIHYRIGNEVFLGTNDWLGEYYSGMCLDFGDGGSTIDNFDCSDSPTAPSITAYNQAVYGNSGRGIIDFPNTDFLAWTNNSNGPIVNWPTGNPYEKYSIRFTREIIIPADVGDSVDITFVVGGDDGYRLWVLKDGESAKTCSNVEYRSLGPVVSGQPNLHGDYETETYNANDATYPDDCLKLDYWRNQSYQQQEVVVSMTPGSYTLQLDYYENGGGAELTFDYYTTSNPDDTQVTTAGVAIADSSPQCLWGQREDAERPNSPPYEWDNFAVEDSYSRGGNRCYLELRGYVYIPHASTGSEPAGLANQHKGLAPMDYPELTWWDKWEYDTADVMTWVEVAEYIPKLAPDGRELLVLDRPATRWIRIPSGHGSSFNWNETIHTLSLSSLPAGSNYVDDGSSAAGLDFRSKKLTYRFVMENRDDDGAEWFVDDVNVFDTGAPQSFLMDSTLYNMNDETLADQQFITTGQWRLTSSNSVSGECCGWDASYRDTAYSRNNEVDGSDEDVVAGMRVHYVEFDGILDSTLPAKDAENDSGDAVISFFHGYKIGRYTKLAVEYYNNTTQQWTAVPDDPDSLDDNGGIMLDRLGDSDSDYVEIVLQEATVNLNPVPQSQFRLRFAMYVHDDADRRDGSWWIDNIKLHREDRKQYLDYPFFDGAEAGTTNWNLAAGTWQRTNESMRSGSHSFTDSPVGEDYQSNTEGVMVTFFPFDLNNDTPENLASLEHNPLGGNGGGAAVDPVLSFWHRRLLNSNDALYVDWRRVDEFVEAESERGWKPLWAYIYRMHTDPNESDSDYAVQQAWEYVEIDLAAIPWELTSASLEDDDIEFRFRLSADDNGSTRDGVYIDDVSLKEYTERTHTLWPTGDVRTVDGVDYPVGRGLTYTSTVDETDWWLHWRAGGGWTAISWEQRDGLQAWHESALGQTEASVYHVNSGRDNITSTDTESLQILELLDIIDLRATRTSERPALYWWNRYATGDNDIVSVQIATELTQTGDALNTVMEGRCRTGLYQCYAQEYGWSAWEDVDRRLWSDGEWIEEFGWKREVIDLTPYASPDTSTPGQRIRIRFVYDSIDNSDSDRARDGWYIDAITIGPRRDQVIERIAERDFFDPARDTSNWVMEGTWGLSPKIFRGEGGGPAVLGSWDEYFWDCDDCEGLVSGTWSTRFLRGTDMFLDNANMDTGVVNFTSPVTGNTVNETAVQRTVFDINYDLGKDAPRPGVFDHKDYIVGRWVLETPYIGSGSGIQANDYTFIITGNNGFRMKYEEIDASGNVINPPADISGECDEWNVVCFWYDHGRMVEMGVAKLEDGKRYRITLDWYEKTDVASIILAVGGSNFSFTDSPVQNVTDDDIPAITGASTSLILDGSLDLSGTTYPVLQYYTKYEIQTDARVDVSIDGGLSWLSGNGNNNSLGNDIYDYGIIEGYDGADPIYYKAYDFDRPDYDGTQVDDWELKEHNLKSYVDKNIIIRFRLQKTGDNDWKVKQLDRTTNNEFMISWWITDIRVADLGLTLVDPNEP